MVFEVRKYINTKLQGFQQLKSYNLYLTTIIFSAAGTEQRVEKEVKMANMRIFPFIVPYVYLADKFSLFFLIAKVWENLGKVL